MISYKEYLEYLVTNEIEYMKDLIGEGFYEGSPIENATDEQIAEIAEQVVDGLLDNDYLNEIKYECERDEIDYQIKEFFRTIDEE